MKEETAKVNVEQTGSLLEEEKEEKNDSPGCFEEDDHLFLGTFTHSSVPQYARFSIRLYQKIRRSIISMLVIWVMKEKDGKDAHSRVFSINHVVVVVGPRSVT